MQGQGGTQCRASWGQKVSIRKAIGMAAEQRRVNDIANDRVIAMVRADQGGDATRG